MGALPAVQNYWPDTRCAKAFWSQQEVTPYRQLLAETLDWAQPDAGEQWLDLGCGSGPLTRAIWERTAGKVAQILGLDCAAVNERIYAELRETLQPAPTHRIRFQCHDFSNGLALLGDRTFDHAVSGLAIQYAESYSQLESRWTTDAYDRILAEVLRVLRPGGRFVFSANVPEPSWWKVGFRSLGDMFRAGRPLRFLKRAQRMMRYGAWLKREARSGRFHYLPAETVVAKLRAAGFTAIEYRLSYANQAFIFRAFKPRTSTGDSACEVKPLRSPAHAGSSAI